MKRDNAEVDQFVVFDFDLLLKCLNIASGVRKDKQVKFRVMKSLINAFAVNRKEWLESHMRLPQQIPSSSQNSFDPNEPLRQSFHADAPVRRILTSEHGLQLILGSRCR